MVEEIRAEEGYTLVYTMGEYHSISVSLSKNKHIDADEGHRQTAMRSIDSGSYTGYEDISREESEIDGAKCVVFEYTLFGSGLVGDTKKKEAYITKSNFTIVVHYGTNTPSKYDTKYFDALLATLRVTK
jgi:hypothetical protein